MRKIKVNTLVLEITERCNMSCAHCLRGPAQDLDMADEIIEKALKDITWIGTLVFTGGEVALYPHAMEVALQYCKDHEIEVESFYLVTNGKDVNEAFLHIVLDWAVYTAPNDYDNMSGISLSSDQFHDRIKDRNKQILKRFSFYREDHQTKKMEYLIKEGRARTLTGNYAFRDPHDYVLQKMVGDSDNCIGFDDELTGNNRIYMYDSNVYVSAAGAVKIGCDDSYINMLNLIGNLSAHEDLYGILERFLTECRDLKDKKGQLYTILSTMEETNHLGGKQHVYTVPVRDGKIIATTGLEDPNQVTYEIELAPGNERITLASYWMTKPSRILIAWHIRILLN